MKLSRKILPLLPLLFSACYAPYEVVEVVEVDPEGWYKPAKIEFEVTDTTTMVALDIIVRYQDVDPMIDSLELMVTTIAPDSVFWSERRIAYTPQSDQEPIATIATPYRDKIKWQQVGTYTIEFHPQHLYEGVSAVGIEIKEDK